MISGICSQTFINPENIIHRMKEKTLLRIALVVSIAGIIALFLISQRIKVDEAMIGRLEQSVDESVLVTGSVVEVNEGNSTTFIRIQKDEAATVVLFGKAPLIQEGDYVQIRGKVTEHDGKTEIIGEEVRVI
jgi:DNA/RNA endonuclease YhcR with UshA esterase domain